jgi:myo-inositol-1(or 4)-monophosphatase
MEKILTGDVAAVAIGAALEAGECLKRGFGTQFGIFSKEEKQNLVTDYDYLSQELILKHIRRYFPSHQILAEEDPQVDLTDQEVLWIVDPLDGTVNFAKSIPFFAVSIAVAVRGEIIVGVVYNPLGNELFVAQRGGGALLNGQFLAVSKVNQLEEAFVATGFPYNVSLNPLRCIDSFTHMAKLGIPLRRLGAAALDLSYVAAGRFDAFWEVGLYPWDMAAGKPHQIFGYLPLVATNGHLHEDLIQTLQEIPL